MKSPNPPSITAWQKQGSDSSFCPPMERRCTWDEDDKASKSITNNPSKQLRPLQAAQARGANSHGTESRTKQLEQQILDLEQQACSVSYVAL